MATGHEQIPRRENPSAYPVGHDQPTTYPLRGKTLLPGSGLRSGYALPSAGPRQAVLILIDARSHRDCRAAGASDVVCTGVSDGAMGQITVYSGVEQRRQWSDEQRALVDAAFAPDAVVAEVARAADVRPSQNYRWRRDLCDAGHAGAGFAPVIVAPSPAMPRFHRRRCWSRSVARSYGSRRMRRQSW